MQKYFEKIKERLEEKEEFWSNKYNSAKKEGDINQYFDGVSDGYNSAIKIVNQVAEEYNQSLANDGWIPCSERLPECEMLCFVTYEWLDGSIHVAKDIYTDGGEWFETKFDSVLAWMPINEPAPYQPKGEK